MNTMQKPLQRHLTDDEVMDFTSRDGSEIPFRIRIWQGANAIPVVMASSVVRPDGTCSIPRTMTKKIANFVNAAVLRHPRYGMIYYEDAASITFPGGREWTLSQVNFEFFGNVYRVRMINPVYRVVEWARFEHLVQGGPVERLSE